MKTHYVHGVLAVFASPDGVLVDCEEGSRPVRFVQRHEPGAIGECEVLSPIGGDCVWQDDDRRFVLDDGLAQVGTRRNGSLADPDADSDGAAVRRSSRRPGNQRFVLCLGRHVSHDREWARRRSNHEPWDHEEMRRGPERRACSCSG